VPESSISNVYLRHVCYLFHKLCREKPREKWILPYYTLYILLYPFVHVLSAKTPSKEEKQRKSTKFNSLWQAEGESVASKVSEHMKSLAPNSQRQSQCASEFAMANNILARRVRAAKTPQSWHGRNPLVKKHQLAMANASTRKASWVRSEIV
jgi:hypothetical protein